MSRIRSNFITNQSADGAPTVSNGLVISGVTTSTSFKGDGSQLTGITQTTINNNANYRLISGDSNANELNAEPNLSFDGTNLKVGNTATTSNYNQTDILLGNHTGHSGMTILSSPSHGGFIMFSDNDGGGENAYRGQIEYHHSDDHMRFLTASAERVRIYSDELRNSTQFFSNKPTITLNKTITTTYNHMSIGNITINSGVTVTVNSGARWVIV